MKVLQINEVYKILSTGRTTLELEEELRRYGHESLVAYAYREMPVRRKEKRKELEKGHYVIGTALDRKIHALRSRLSGLQGYFSNGATQKLIRYINKQKPDIVHLHNVHGNFLNLNKLLAYLGENNIAVVVTLHDCWFYTGRCTHYTVNCCYQWRRAARNVLTTEIHHQPGFLTAAEGCGRIRESILVLSKISLLSESQIGLPIRLNAPS